MRPSSLGGGHILRRTLSVRLSVCLLTRTHSDVREAVKRSSHWLRQRLVLNSTAQIWLVITVVSNLNYIWSHDRRRDRNAIIIIIIII